jgi:putative ABC transport system ATP-binding protein
MNHPPGVAPFAIVTTRLTRRYISGDTRVEALAGVDLEVPTGSICAVAGPSGSGKTTLINMVAGLDRPDEGDVEVMGRHLNTLSERELDRYRAETVGVVFQDPHLLPGLTALENVVAARLPWAPRTELEAEARHLLAAVGLERRMHFPPARLSGGERQRVGFARALLGRRPILLADEPTGNLDAETTGEILELVVDLRRSFELTTVIATHDPTVQSIADSVARLEAGRLVETVSA